jgi:hypothetical protein
MIKYLLLWTAYWREYIYIYATWGLVINVDISSKYFKSVPTVTNDSGSKRPLAELTRELCFALDFRQKRNCYVIYSASTFIWLNIATYD